jgi:hypothetical protein
MKTRILLLLPLALALGGCYTMETPHTYGYPAAPYYGYGPTPQHYSYNGAPYGYAPYPTSPAQPAVVAPRTYHYVPAPAVSQYDDDRDGVHNGVDRFPSDPRRW